MRKSKMLARMRAGQPARVGMLGTMIPAYIAFAADLGLDGIWLDLEHRPMEDRDVQFLLVTAHLYDVDIMIRPHTREKATLYRYLEDGATGFMIPHVSTPGEVQDLVWKVKFPPVGDRGIGPANLQANYGLDTQQSRQPLVDHALRETFLFVQVETPLGIGNVEAMAAVPGLDGLCLAPADLALRMQYEPEGRRLSYEQCMERVAAAAQAQGKFWGAFPRSLDDHRTQHGLGSNFYVWGNDHTLLLNGLRQSFLELNEILL